MDGIALKGVDPLSPPPRIFERLSQIGGYTWDESRDSFHSSYDNWHIFGTKNRSSSTARSSTPLTNSRLNRVSAPLKRPVLNESSDSSSSLPGTGAGKSESRDVNVLARISFHALREERSYQLCQSLSKSVDPEGKHIVRPVDVLRLPSQQGDPSPIVVSIFEAPGYNDLIDYMDFGPAWYRSRSSREPCTESIADSALLKQISVPAFLDFAIGATECLEILHHGQRIVHGEIRGDAFHFTERSGQVRLINFGSGLRSFEHGLTSTGWSSLSKETGAKTKLSYISPEQTGRMPAEPDSRTDIYSLGVLFWTLLTQQSPFDGDTPMDIIQGVLGRRLPGVSTVRLDVPDAIGRVIQKMTSKIIGDRYHSASGLKYDLQEIQRLLGQGDSEALISWKIASRDVSSYFILPNVMIGRQQEHDEIVKVIEKVSRRHIESNRQGLHSLSSNTNSSSQSDLLPDSIESHARSNTDSLSDSAEGGSGNFPARRNSIGNTPQQVQRGHDGSQSTQSAMSGNSVRSNTGLPKPWEKNSSLSITNSSVVERSFNSSSDADRIRSSSDGVGSLVSTKNVQKFSRKGRCEVISIAGAAGLGKSCLVQSVQVEARRRGYFASSKFDQARKTPFGPVLKLLTSLFKQVFSESESDTPFHQLLKQYVRPAWPMLHKVLGLPEFLLGQPLSIQNLSTSNLSTSNLSTGQQSAHIYRRSLQSSAGRRGSSPSSSRASMLSMNYGAQSSQDFLRSGSSTKSMRLMNTFLDVLRVFAVHKFICFCLDDLQFADEESLELITQLISSRMKMVMILTYRPDEMLPERIKAIIEPPNTEGIRYLKTNGVGVTRVALNPLSEQDITQYIATTLSRPAEDIVPLAAVVQAKTAGNPFYMREMLDACHRNQCLWYDYKVNMWNYDLDKIFRNYSAENYHTVLDGDFVSRRLNELPSASRSILGWASLIGHSFSFEFVQRLLSGEFNDETTKYSEHGESVMAMTHSQQETIAGLQAAIQAYILVATEDDDRFRFSHDRYIQAAASLREHSGPEMHFVIAQNLLKYYPADERQLDSTASHICEAVDVINSNVVNRHTYRKLLFDRALVASESGARSTAVKFYAHCFALLQTDPWDGDALDVYYDETLQLFTRAAETFHYVGDIDQASYVLHQIFDRARTPIDKSPAWILQSRIHSQRGEVDLAFQSLTKCLEALGVNMETSATTMEKCDAEFERLALKIQGMDRNELIAGPMSKDSNLAVIGAVLTETVNAAFWTDKLKFYQTALLMATTHLKLGGFPHSGLSYLYLGMIAISRFNMLSFASELGNICIDLLDRWRDSYALGQGGTLYGLLLGHIQHPVSVSFGQLENALEYTIQTGDRLATIMNFGMVAVLKFLGSEHVGELEAFCTYGCEEVPDWQYDCRGGTMIMAVRQACRSLQGKTNWACAEEVMSDESHDTTMYLTWIKDTIVDSDRPLTFYQSVEIAPLFLYGHYDRAVQIGKECQPRIDTIWSARNSRFIMFFHGLALAGLLWCKDEGARIGSVAINQHDVESALKQLRTFRKRIVDWQTVTDVNYLAWSKLLDAQISELENNYGQTLRNYEEALDHAAINGFTFEEALGNYLLAGYFLRRGGRRSAKAALRETIMLYRQFGAVGVAQYIEEEHNLLLQGPTRNLRTADAGVQTDFAGDSAPVQYNGLEAVDENERTQTRSGVGVESKGDRIGAWQGLSARPEAGSGLPALDMLDLTSILESSQVISSILSVEQLLTTMCEIILSNCGGLATLAAIVVEEDDPMGWSVAASGDPETGATAHVPGLPLTETPLIAESVILYCTRFRETVFLPDLVHDERFSNVSEAWTRQNPLGKSVIAIPISHGDKPLLGVLYLEGEPNAFTDRNLTVLGLLVNQIGISYSNALTLKAIEKVSASNVSMVLSQKQALAKAREAEMKAKLAEAEALRSVKLAEEAAKAKSIFLANVSHELRTPLNGVIGNSELLRASGLNEEQADMADSIRVSADLLLTVINDILDFSKMEADKMQLFITAFKPQELLKEVVRSVSYSNNDKRNRNVEIVQDISIPASMVFGDPVRVHQVLGNLIGNSMKFTDMGTITIGAKVESESMDTLELTFWVKDTGIGIPPAQLKKLFKPFSQADASTARKYGGSGLGLSICRSLIESMMGGKIELDSAEGQGTTAWFTVSFPKAGKETTEGDCLDVNDESDRLEQPSYNGVGEEQVAYNDFSHVPREELRICIAEDNLINQKIAIQFVQKLGFKFVDAYDNGLAAVEGLRKKANEGVPYHLLLCDVQMPVCDGYEATILIRKDPIPAVRGILIIAMTASAIQGDREKCLESGMNDYLAKPVRVQVLKKKLEQYLQQPTVPIPNLQAEAKKLALHVLENAKNEPQVSTVHAHAKSPSPKSLPNGNAQLSAPNDLQL